MYVSQITFYDVIKMLEGTLVHKIKAVNFLIEVTDIQKSYSLMYTSWWVWRYPLIYTLSPYIMP